MTRDYNDDISGWKIAGVGLAAAAVLTGAGIGIYALTAGTAGVRGAVALHNNNETAENRVSAEAQWNAAWKDYCRDSANLTMVQKQYATSDPQGFIISSQEAVNQDVQTYNTLASQPLTKDWLPSNLPSSITSNTPCNN